MRLRILAAALAGFLAAAPLAANAQIQPIYTSQVWLPQSKLSPAISVTTSSAATLLPVITGQTLPGAIGWFCNTGSNDAYLAFGTANTVAATVAAGSWLKAATCAAYPLNLRPGVTYTYVAAIGSGGSTTITVETGLGTPPLSIASSGGGGGGGAVTIASGAVASGAYSSGSIASGAFASGSIASGALASGSISAGALAIGAGVDGWDLSVGARADTACATDNGTCALLALVKRTNQNLTTLNTSVQGPIPAGSAIIGALVANQSVNVAQINGVTPLMGNGATGTGSARVTLANDNTIPTGWPTAAGQSAIQPRSLSAATTGGCTPGKILSAASNNSTLIGSAGTRTLCKLIAINTSATIYYLKTYDKATAPTCGTDTPAATYPIPPSNGGVAVPLGTYGEAYALGLGVCYVAGLADNDNTSAATGTAISYSFK